MSEHQEPQRSGVENAFARFAALEGALAGRVLEYLRSRSDLSIIGPVENDSSRVATISFVHKKRHSADIVRIANERKYGIRYGHFYAYRLCERLASEGILHDVEDGVIRISALHYNSTEEIEGLIHCLDEVLS